ncbi:hypothetical protein Celaphus_00000516 [Cervus elaphus hippelaphus]|uniref:Uncharacterized protein n=1 Tax=Cervus elaphus hippelaphus TaxID=46360 RepID=A0A212DBB8_CEREH|nr:hypothetical protein Celaphus_00000516 [Cervus elaphus hippelaphus]
MRVLQNDLAPYNLTEETTSGGSGDDFDQGVTAVVFLGMFSEHRLGVIHPTALTHCTSGYVPRHFHWQIGSKRWV